MSPVQMPMSTISFIVQRGSVTFLPAECSALTYSPNGIKPRLNRTIWLWLFLINFLCFSMFSSFSCNYADQPCVELQFPLQKLISEYFQADFRILSNSIKNQISSFGILSSSIKIRFQVSEYFRAVLKSGFKFLLDSNFRSHKLNK